MRGSLKKRFDTLSNINYSWFCSIQIPYEKKGSTMAKAQTVTVIEIPKLSIETIDITLIGDSPLIVHRWSEKAKKQMLDKQMKKATSGKEAKNPEQDYLDSLYKHPDGGYGFPTIGIKAAGVSACSQIDGITKVDARASFHIDGELVKIDGKPKPREDMVRIAMGTADLRYRGEFTNWKTTFSVKFNSRVLSAEQIVNIFNVAGFGVGIGEWRPQKNGSYGRFHVKGVN